MKILHVGWGFQPFRGGGLIEYAEDLMNIQVQKGYDVTYFCTGRFKIFSNKPRLKKWKSDKGYQVYELLNPPIISGYDGGTQTPLWDVNEPLTEKYFMQVVNEIQPDIIHIQEFLGVPTNVLSQLKIIGIKTVFTIEDYFVLCPTVKLVKTNGELCRIKDLNLGKQCEICSVNAPKHNIKYKLFSMYPTLFNKKTLNVYRNIRKLIGLSKTSYRSSNIDELTFDHKKVDLFNSRRNLNLMAMNNIDLVIAMSNKVADIFNYYQPLPNMIILNLTLKHIDNITPLPLKFNANNQIVFGIINCMTTALKGKKLMLQVFDAINDNELLKSNVRFEIFGKVSDEDSLTLKNYSFVRSNGRFDVKNLNAIFEDCGINVGIVPSMWEEAYGYVGVEFLAKGIPVIGNNFGGIPDYVIDNETGWLNTDCSVDGMLNIISQLVLEPAQIKSYNQNIIQNRGKYIKTMESHFHEMDKIYKNLIISPQTSTVS